MKKKWLVAAALPVVAAGVAVMTPLKAADHLDGKQTGVVDDVVKDPASDITDFYTFTPTGRAGRVVFIMNVGPLGSVSKFSDKVEYAFRIRPFKGAAPDATQVLDIKCKADAAGANMTCTGPNGLTKTSPTDTPGACGAADDMCVFAGKRSDPFFLDFQALTATLKGGTGPQFCKGDGGPDAAPTATYGNFFDKKNVASIVVEVNAAKLVGTDAGVGGLPLLGAAAETTRLGN